MVCHIVSQLLMEFLKVEKSFLVSVELFQQHVYFLLIYYVHLAQRLFHVIRADIAVLVTVKFFEVFVVRFQSPEHRVVYLIDDCFKVIKSISCLRVLHQPMG